MGLTVNDRTITHVRAHISEWGLWYVDATVDSSEAMVGLVTVQLNDLTLKGAVLAGTPELGRLPLRIVGGRGKWGAILPAKSYANDAGVKVATIVRDAAESCGEDFDASTASGVVGPAFVRPEGPAARVLELVAPGRWYVGEDGITRLGKRPARELPSGVTRVDGDAARGTVTLASEALAGLLPGVVVDGITAVDVVHEGSPSKLRTTVWGARGDRYGGSRRLAAMQQLHDALDPDRAFRATYEYRVDGTEGKRLNLSPVRKSTGMPSLLRVPVYPGVSGADADLDRGAIVLVTFLNADPSRPAVVGFEDARGANFVPDILRFAEGGSGEGIVRKSDEICLGYFCADTTTNTIYRSPASLGPLLTIYEPAGWWKVASVADVKWCAATNPSTPTVPPPPGTPGTPLYAYHTSASGKVRCG